MTQHIAMLGIGHTLQEMFQKKYVKVVQFILVPPKTKNIDIRLGHNIIFKNSPSELHTWLNITVTSDYVGVYAINTNKNKTMAYFDGPELHRDLWVLAAELVSHALILMPKSTHVQTVFNLDMNLAEGSYSEVDALQAHIKKCCSELTNALPYVRKPNIRASPRSTVSL